MRASVIRSAVLLVLAGCAEPPPPAATGPDLTSAAAFVDSFITSLAHPDAPGMVRLDTADFVWGRSGALLSADSLGALLSAQRAARKEIVLGTSDVRLTVLGPRAAVWSGLVSGVVQDSLGKQRQVQGALMLVLRQDGTDWVIAAGHESVRPFDEAHEAAAGRAP